MLAHMVVPARASSQLPCGELTLGEVNWALLTVAPRDQAATLALYCDQYKVRSSFLCIYM